MSSIEQDTGGIDVAAAATRLADFLRGYASTGAHVLRRGDTEEWQKAAREEFLRRRLRLVTAFDDELLLAIGLGLIDVTETAEAVWREASKSQG